MIIDCFMFFNEIEILEIRLKELYHIVDQFLIVECGETHAGLTKPFVFEKYKVRFSKYSNKINYFKLAGLPPLKADNEQDRFFLERFQRNSLLNFLVGSNLKREDVILISDLDEIPRASLISDLVKSEIGDKIYVFEQKLFKNYFNFRIDDLPDLRWLGTIAVSYSTLGEYLPSELRINVAEAGRLSILRKSHNDRVIIAPNAGWHLSYFGGENVVKYKMAHFAHGSDYVNLIDSPPSIQDAQLLENLALHEGKPLEAIENFVKTELLNDLPICIVDNLSDYKFLFKL